MAGKSMVFASRHLSYAMDKLSKNALADLVIDLVRGSVGADADESEVVASLQPFVDATLRARGDRPIVLTAAMAQLTRYDDAYRQRQADAAKVMADHTTMTDEMRAAMQKPNLSKPVWEC